MKGWHQPPPGLRIPICCQRRGGRKRIVAPDGSAIVPTSKPEPDGTLIKALARARRWQRVLESGEYGTLAELSAAEQTSRSYICRVLRLTLLARDVVERIMDGEPTAGLDRSSRVSTGVTTRSRFVTIAWFHDTTPAGPIRSSSRWSRMRSAGLSA
jgi:hypothetical protein